MTKEKLGNIGMIFLVLGVIMLFIQRQIPPDPIGVDKKVLGISKSTQKKFAVFVTAAGFLMWAMSKVKWN